MWSLCTVWLQQMLLATHPQVFGVITIDGNLIVNVSSTGARQSLDTGSQSQRVGGRVRLRLRSIVAVSNENNLLKPPTDRCCASRAKDVTLGMLTLW